MRRFLRAEHLLPVTALVIFLVTLVAAPASACTTARPCLPDPLSWVALGALAAPAIMVYADRTAAAWATVACAACWLIADRLTPGALGWPAMLPWLYAAVGVAVARTRPETRDAGRRTAAPPAPPGLPRVGTRLVALAGVLIAGSVALTAWTVWRQDAVERRQTDARVAGGVVRDRIPNDGLPEIGVGLTDGSTVRVRVRSLDDYPAGAQVQLLLDDDGLRQLRSEPYDLTPLLAVPVAGVGLAAAILARVARRRRRLRDLFTGPQPVRRAWVEDEFGFVHVLVPAPDGRTATEFGLRIHEANEPPELDEVPPEPVSATVYGEPRTGGWCAVEVGGRVRVPLAPVGRAAEVPYDAEHHQTRELADDDAQAVDPAQLTLIDRRAAPDQVREHRVAAPRRWFEAVGIGLGCALATAQLIHVAGRWTGWPALVTVTLVAAVAYEFGWRTELRPVLLWDVGGIAAITSRGRERAVWTTDSGALHDDDGTVIVTTGDVVLMVDAPRPWPSWAAQRTADQLVAALRDARRQALDTAGAPAPPDLAEPNRPAVLYLLWALTTAGTAALFGWLPL